MPNIGSIVQPLYGMLGGTGITIGILIGCCFVLWGGLVFRKRRKMNKPVLQMYDLGNGIFDFQNTKGGWFGSRLTLFGLWDYGSETMFRLKDNTPVFDVSHHDYRSIDGKNGIVVVRNPHDPKVAIPISKFHLGAVEQIKDSNGKVIGNKVTTKGAAMALAQIAPVELRNMGVNLLDLADTEMKSSMEKWMPIIALGTIAIVLVLITIFNTQYGKNMVDKSVDLLKQVTVMVANKATTVAPGVAP